MRIYIISNDGITRCHEAPVTVNAGEIAVASSEELHAAPLSGNRLLTLWNALPGVAKRRKVGDREALIDQLWAANGSFGVDLAREFGRRSPYHPICRPSSSCICQLSILA